MKLLAKFLPVAADFYSIERLVVSEQLGVLEFCVVQKLSLKLSLLAPLYFLVKGERLARVLP